VQEFTISQTIDGNAVDRRVLVHAPQSVSSDSCYPVLFVMHGNGGQPDGFVKRFGDWVDEGDFIAVYPEGHLKSWNLGKEASTADDVSFIEQAADQLSNWGNLDHNRRYAYGFSNGAGMAHKLGIESSYFRAFVAVVTSLTTANLPGASSGNPAVMQILGEDDSAIPYEGGTGIAGHEFLSGEDSAKTWAEHNGCDLTPEVTTTSQGNERFAYSDCTKDADVIHYKAVGKKHSIPESFEGGLSKLVWDFLSAH